MGIFCIWIVAIFTIVLAAQTPVAPTVDSVLADYVKAVGGLEAVDQFTTREIVFSGRRGKTVTIYWQKPNNVLELINKQRSGYDGARCWTMSQKGKIRKLSRGAEVPLEMEANPLRYVHIKDFYTELDAAPAEEIDGEKMNVLVAPNNLAATKLYFDAKTHLLRRVEEKGETSAYFTSTVDYLDYREVDGVRLPYEILHATTEPGNTEEVLRVKKVTHNVALRPEIFSKPIPGQVVLGGKR